MGAYVAGYSSVDKITYCPFCKSRVHDFWADGMVKCLFCGKRFAVIVDEEEEEEDED